ncbi:hypothetical protein TNCV_3437481 [Trichonephila clavipes]|nr:hypothetical protein TNCV_3437481 [Trichonephila clavipes]
MRGYVKSLVYANKPQTLDHLEGNIRRVIADIRPQMLEKVIENWTSRLDYIRASRGKASALPGESLKKRDFEHSSTKSAILFSLLLLRTLGNDVRGQKVSGTSPSSAFQALASIHDKQSSRVQSCRELLSIIPTKVVLQWVNSHCGLWGNEMAELLANRDMDILQRSIIDLPIQSSKLEIDRIYKKCFPDAAASVAKNKPRRVLIKPNCVSDSPRAAVVGFRLLTGRDCLCANLFRFNLTDPDPPLCILCTSGQSWTLLI